MAGKAGAILGAFKAAIELFGHHPLATGSLALGGLAFSVFVYFDDSKRAQADQASAQQIEQRLSEIDGKVSGISATEAESEGFVPITVRGGRHFADNIFAPPSEMDRLKGGSIMELTVRWTVGSRIRAWPRRILSASKLFGA